VESTVTWLWLKVYVYERYCQAPEISDPNVTNTWAPFVIGTETVALRIAKFAE